MRATWRTELPQWALIATLFVLAALTWPAVPDRLPHHRHLLGHGFGHAGKVEFVLLPPLVALGLYLGLRLVPRIDPGWRNYAQFAGAYTVFRLVTLALAAAADVVLLRAARGQPFHAPLLVLALMGLVLVIVGSVLGKVRPNWFVGIRTPWTLSSKRAWTQTHRLGGQLFVLLGLVFVAAAIAGPTAHAVLPLLVGVSVAGLLALVVYSYLVWRTDPAQVPPAGTLPAEGE